MDIRGRGILAAAACALGLGVFAPVAGASTVEIIGDAPNKVLRYTADPGEANLLSITAGATGYTLTDTGTVGAPPVPLTLTSATCAVAGSTATCAATDLVRIEVVLGDGNDELHIRSADLPVTAEGGDGIDTFDDDEVSATITATRHFSGGPGDDYMRASVTSSLLAHDYVGGEGTDFVDYNYRGPNEGGPAVPHWISLNDVADDGVAGELDNVHSDIERVIGSEGSDTITGTAGNDYFITSQGADVADGLGGNDRMYASIGCDADVLTGGEGDDTFHLGGDTTVHGDAGDDRIVSEDDSCAAGDDVNGGPGRDEVDLGLVSAPLTASLDNQANDGLGGADNFHDDVEDLSAGAEATTLIGSAAANILIGGPKNDRLDGGGGADQLIGLGGVDVVDYSSRTAALNLSPGEDADDGEAGENDRIWEDVENLRGGAGADVLTGDADDNVLDGGLGSDTISGGAGADAVDYSARTAPVTVTLASGPGDDGQPGESDTITDVEGAFGGQGNDTLASGGGDGVLSGGAGNDVLRDTAGSDRLDAGAGNDDIDSADGAADTLACGDGTDKVKSDQVDTLAGDCEPASLPAPPTPPAPSAPPANPAPPTPPVAPIDRTAPSASVSVRKGQDLGDLRSAGLKLTVKVGEASTLAGTLTAESSTRRVLKRRGIPVKAVLGSGRTDAAKAGSKALTVRLTKRGRRALRRLGGARLKLVVTVTDRAGNRRTVTSHLRVRS